MASPERFLPLPSTSFHILLTLADGVAHGYGIKHRVEERTGNQIRLAAGTLYETMQRLLRQQLVERAAAPQGHDATSRWRFYGLTPLGHDVLVAETERLESDVAFARARLLAASESR